MRAMSEVLPARARRRAGRDSARSPRGCATVGVAQFYRVFIETNAHVVSSEAGCTRFDFAGPRTLLGPWVARYTNPTLISTQTSSFAFRFVFWTSSWRVFHVSSTFAETIFVSFGTCLSKYPLKPSSSKPINSSMSMLSSLVGL